MYDFFESLEAAKIGQTAHDETKLLDRSRQLSGRRPRSEVGRMIRVSPNEP
jgi:hypothetical protein